MFGLNCDVLSCFKYVYVNLIFRWLYDDLMIEYDDFMIEYVSIWFNVNHV